MFMLPGVLHCAGGAGPDRADWTHAIEEWVEKNQAPERVIASKMSGGKPVRTRPVCVYPQKAVYSGTGSIDEEQNFVCK
jgi:feruloyl esterase